MQPVIIVFPVYKSVVTNNEEVSFRQCLKVLGKHPIALAAPVGLDSHWYQSVAAEYGVTLQVRSFAAAYFQNVQGYNSLLLSKTFYQAFAAYRYMLLHQLDVFVFEDRLAEWCDKGYDYTGAPWYSGYSNTAPAGEPQFEGVGNGGFSLRNIAAHIAILHYKWEATWQIIRQQKNWFSGQASLLKLKMQDAWSHRIFIHEDALLFQLGKLYPSQYKVPGPLEALSFSMELQPARSYALNGNRLPFGCHAWWKYDLAFWKPFIESFGWKVDMS